MWCLKKAGLNYTTNFGEERHSHILLATREFKYMCIYIYSNISCTTELEVLCVRPASWPWGEQEVHCIKLDNVPNLYCIMYDPDEFTAHLHTSRWNYLVNQDLVRCCQTGEGTTASIFSSRNRTGVDSQLIIIRATRAISPGYWCVVRARPAVNVHRNPVNRMKNGSSRLG